MWLADSLRILLHFISFYSIFSDQCINFRNDNRIKSSIRMTGGVIETITPSGLITCAKKCLYYTACQSWNFRWDIKRCEINKNSVQSDPGNVVHENGWYHGSRIDWAHLVTDACRNHTCSILSRCYATNNYHQAMCIMKGCRQPASLRYASESFYPVGKVLIYKTSGTPPNQQTSTCKTNGQWTKLKLPDIKDCGVVKPPLPTMRIRTITGVKINDTITYECDNGHNPIGNFTIRCTPTGVWTNLDGICVPVWCDHHYRYHPGAAMCYQLYVNATVYGKASKACSPGQLVNVNSDIRMAALVDVLTAFKRKHIITDNDNIWIQRHHIHVHGQQLSKGSSNSTRECIAVTTKELPNMVWHTTLCHQSAFYICEKLDPFLPA